MIRKCYVKLLNFQFFFLVINEIFVIQVVMDNGLVRVIFSNPGGDVIGIKYNGIDNLLSIENERSDRG